MTTELKRHMTGMTILARSVSSCGYWLAGGFVLLAGLGQNARGVIVLRVTFNDLRQCPVSARLVGYLGVRDSEALRYVAWVFGGWRLTAEFE